MQRIAVVGLLLGVAAAGCTIPTRDDWPDAYLATAEDLGPGWQLAAITMNVGLTENPGVARPILNATRAHAAVYEQEGNDDAIASYALWFDTPELAASAANQYAESCNHPVGAMIAAVDGQAVALVIASGPGSSDAAARAMEQVRLRTGARLTCSS